MLDPPVPVSAVFNLPFMQLTVAFSHPVRFHTPNATASWFLRAGNLRWTIASVSVGPLVVLIAVTPGVGDPGPNVCSYSPPPVDVVSDTARPIPAPAFSDFPVT